MFHQPPASTLGHIAQPPASHYQSYNAPQTTYSAPIPQPQAPLQPPRPRAPNQIIIFGSVFDLKTAKLKVETTIQPLKQYFNFSTSWLIFEARDPESHDFNARVRAAIPQNPSNAVCTVIGADNHTAWQVLSAVERVFSEPAVVDYRVTKYLRDGGNVEIKNTVPYLPNILRLYFESGTMRQPVARQMVDFAIMTLCASHGFEVSGSGQRTGSSNLKLNGRTRAVEYAEWTLIHNRGLPVEQQQRNEIFDGLEKFAIGLNLSSSRLGTALHFLGEITTLDQTSTYRRRACIFIGPYPLQESSPAVRQIGFGAV